MNLVLDASMTLAWLFIRADSDEAALALQAIKFLPTVTVSVPPIWFSEVANGLIRGERQGSAQSAQTTFFLNWLSQSNIVVDSSSPWIHQSNALSLARIHLLTVYDACYLELALRLGAQIATFDRKLATAARSAGVHVFGDPQ